LADATVRSVTGVTSGQPGQWQTHGERAIYQSPWVWLGQVHVQPPGEDRYWHHVVRLRRAAVMALLDDQARVLLIWRHRFVPDRWGYELPGGLVDDGEEPAQAAARELREETGYRAGQVEYLLTFQPMPGTVDSEHYVFTGRDPERTGAPTDLAEAARVEWVPLESIPALIDAGHIWNAGSLTALPLLLVKNRI
jgi:8-oxo-dGDP phosphatase